MYVLPIIGLLFQGAVLWFIIVWVTQEHDLPWRDVLKWVVLAVAAGLAGMLLASYVLGLPYLLGLLIAVALQLAVLYLIFRHQNISPRKSSIIISAFFVVRVVFALPRLLTLLNK
jgi:hypothetical protein